MLQSSAPGFAHIFKANPYQDALGRFTSKDKNVSGASEREKSLKEKHGVSIASAGSSKDSMAGGAAYGKALKKGEVANSKAWQGTVKDLHDTLDDLSDRLGLDLKSKGIVLLARDSDDTGAAGLAQVGGNAMSFSSALQSRKRVAQDRANNEAFAADNGGRNWGYAEGIISNKPKAVTEKDRAEYAQAVMRHEIGHLLTQPKHVKQFKKAMADIGANRAWAKDNISVYGASKTIEAMAEAFAMFTDKRYTSGKLPKQVEDVMTNMLNDTKPTKKSDPQGYTPAEFAKDSVGDDEPWDDDIPEVEEAPSTKASTGAVQSIAKGFAHILKANPYHDELGRFTDGNKAKFVSIGGVFDRRRNKGTPQTPEVSARIDEFFDRKDIAFDASAKDGWKKDYPDVDPHDMMDAVFGKDATLNDARISYDNESGNLTVEALGGTTVHGSKVVMVMRTLNKSTGIVSHDYLKIADEAERGAGTVKKMFAESIPLYQKMGLKKVAVHANLDAGGYAWGRYGFKDSKAGTFASLATSTGFNVQTLVRKIFPRIRNYPEDVTKELDALDELVTKHSDDPYFPMLITSVKTPALTAALHANGIAKRDKSTFMTDALRSVHWYGDLDMADERQMKHLSNYVGKPLPVRKP